MADSAESLPTVKPGPRRSAEVLFQDADLLVIDKPAGLLVHTGWARERDTALRLARGLAGRHVYPAHRLDRATSGVLVFALSAQVAGAVGEQFASGSVRKRYVAAVRGEIAAELLIDHALPRGEDKAGPRVQARTLVRRLCSVTLAASVQNAAVSNGHPLRYSWLEALPETGRLHQIRRHLKHAGHPLLGDVRYGRGEHNRLCRELYGLTRLALHAEALELTHPRSGQRLLLRAALPHDLSQPLSALGLLSPAG